MHLPGALLKRLMMKSHDGGWRNILAIAFGVAASFTYFVIVMIDAGELTRT